MVKLQQNKESFQNNRPPLNQNDLEFKESFIMNELQTQLEVKNVSIAKLKEHIVNLKGKNVVESVQYVNNSYTVTSQVYKLDLPPLFPCIKINRDARVNHLKVTQEHTDTLRGIVEQARALKHLDNALDYACRTFTLDGNTMYTLYRFSPPLKLVPPKKPTPTQVVKTTPGSSKSGKLTDITNVYKSTFVPWDSGMSSKHMKVQRYQSSTLNDWDILFQLMFDEFFNPPPSVVSPLHAAAARRHADLTGSPVSTSLE
ncbi:hypothetical protein Tco_1305320 [Tanacetum coccineum]